MDRKSEILPYAASFSAFLLARMGKEWLGHIRTILLFGSVAQGRAQEESDIDVFVDARLPATSLRRLRSRCQALAEEFSRSREALLLKTKGIYNTLSITAGNLDVWPEMKASLSATGIVLYGSYRATFEKRGLRHQLLFVWEAAGRNRGAFLNKLYGYRIKKKRYKGCIERFGGEKVGKAAALLPVERRDEFTRVLETHAVPYTIKEVFV